MSAYQLLCEVSDLDVVGIRSRLCNTCAARCASATTNNSQALERRHVGEHVVGQLRDVQVRERSGQARQGETLP